MAIKYKYKGQEVEPVPGQQFSSHWNVYYNMPTENGGSKQVIVTAVPGETLEIVDDTVATPAPSTNDSEQIGTLLNINLAGYTTIRKQFPGIGRVAPSQIVKRRPDGGYRDIDELIELNKDLNINWEQLKELLIFTPLDK